MKRGLLLFLSLLGIVACRTSADYPSRGPKSFKIDYRYEDDPHQRRILLYFSNTSSRSICFGAENWPQNGILLNTGEEVWLTVSGRRYFLAPEQDYCPRCAKKIVPGENFPGYLSYDSFGLKKEDEFSEKQLFFSPVGFSCR
jgi:hypothetical protein